MTAWARLLCPFVAAGLAYLVGAFWYASFDVSTWASRGDIVGIWLLATIFLWPDKD